MLVSQPIEQVILRGNKEINNTSHKIVVGIDPLNWFTKDDLKKHQSTLLSNSLVLRRMNRFAIADKFAWLEVHAS